VVGLVVVTAEAALVVEVVEPPPQPAATDTSASAQTNTQAARVIGVRDGCHSQSSRAAGMVRADGSESDGP